MAKLWPPNWNSICAILAHFVKLSGGDKENLLASIYGGLGGAIEITRLENDMHNIMRTAVRPHANARYLKNAVASTSKLGQFWMPIQKSAKAKLRMRGYTAKLIKRVDKMPLKPLKPGQSAESARKEMLDDAAAVERKRQLAHQPRQEGTTTRQNEPGLQI